MVDPLFQRVLVNECRSRKIPVIFDEVFTGFWRLGVEVISLNDHYSLFLSSKKKTVIYTLHLCDWQFIFLLTDYSGFNPLCP